MGVFLIDYGVELASEWSVFVDDAIFSVMKHAAVLSVFELQPAVVVLDKES